MTARLRITIDIPDWSVAELKRWVADEDFDPYREEEIDVKDILTVLFGGILEQEHIIVDQAMTDEPDEKSA